MMETTTTYMNKNSPTLIDVNVRTTKELFPAIEIQLRPPGGGIIESCEKEKKIRVE